MGYIVPKKNPVAEVKQYDRKFLDMALIDVMNATTKDEEGNIRSNAQRIALGLVNTALYAETPKDRISATKLIYERVGGKPAVIEEEDREEMPTISVRLKTSDAQKIKEIEAMDNYEEEPEDRVVVEIDDGPRMEF